MKITYTQVLLTILFPLMGSQLFSCVRNEPCPEPPETITVDISSGLKSKIPYSGYDTLVFIRTSIGDTHVFIGQGLKKSYSLLRIPSGNPECQAMKGDAKTESLSYSFVSTTFNSPIVMDMYYYQYPGSPWIDIRFNNKLYDAPSTVLSAYAYDSLQIGNKIYYNLAQIADGNNPGSEAYFVLYNASFGILKFRFISGEEWELLSQP